MLAMHVGEKHHYTSFNLIPDCQSNKKVLRAYLDNIVKNVEEGRGIIFTGALGRGKTGSAVLCLKEVVSRGGTALMVAAEMLSDNFFGEREKKRYDESLTMADAMMSVDLLLIDDLMRETDKTWGEGKVEQVIRRRYDAGLPTIITANSSISQLNARYPAAMSVLTERSIICQVSGVKWRSRDDNKPVPEEDADAA